MPEQFVGAADEFGTVARLAQGVGADDAYGGLWQTLNQLSETTQAVESALHGFLAELALVVQAGSQLHLFAEPLKNADLAMLGAGQHDVEAVGAKVDGGEIGR